MADRSFTLTARDVNGLGAVRITAAATPDVWQSLHARLLIAGAEALSVPTTRHGVTSGSFMFSGVSEGRVSPEGYELDAFMRKLFVGLNAGKVEA